MKTFTCFILGATIAAATWSAQAQYSIDWWSIDGGGGQSTGGVFSVTGTIGQPDAGVMSGGNFTLQGGFWGVVAAIQTPGAPLLSITQVNGVVTVSWATPADGWLLDRTLTLSGTPIPWNLVSQAYYLTNPAKISVSITNVPPTANIFFRLHKP